MSEINLIDFYKSIADELNTVKNRVRNLIGNRHWGKEGEYKEAILRNVIRRFLPKNYSIGTGFVLAHYGEVSYVTSQIDIIIYDNTHPILFQEGDFVILTPQCVHAIIEVKTSLRSSSFKVTAQKIIDNARLIRQNQGKMIEVNSLGIPEEKQQNLFIGLFSYGASDKADIFYEILKNLCIEEKSKGGEPSFERCFINDIVLSEDIIINFKQYSAKENRLTLYRMKKLSYSNFIINLNYMESEFFECLFRHCCLVSA
jgi:hypothetical protein